MKTAEAVLGNLAGLLWGNWMLFVLLGLGVFYTIATGGIQFRSIPRIIKELCPKKDRTEPSRDHKGTVSSIQALYMAIASCVGSGNIVGVATALIAGGPGALFWMWAAAFLGMATKYAEIVLGLVFRQKGADGSYYGGPMYYIEKDSIHGVGRSRGGSPVFPECRRNVDSVHTISGAAFQVFGVPKAVYRDFNGGCHDFYHWRRVETSGGCGSENRANYGVAVYCGGAVVVFTNLDSILPMFRSILQDACSMKAGWGPPRADNEGGHAFWCGQGTVFQ